MNRIGARKLTVKEKTQIRNGKEFIQKVLIMGCIESLSYRSAIVLMSFLIERGFAYNLVEVSTGEYKLGFQRGRY